MTKKILIALIAFMIVILGVMTVKIMKGIGNDQPASSEVAGSDEEKQEEENKEEQSQNGQEEENSSGQSSEEQNTLDPEEDPRFFDTDSLLVCANKKHSLPYDYVPSDLAYPIVDYIGNRPLLRLEAAEAIEYMFAAAEKDGVNLQIQSSFRSAEYQAQLYSGYQSSYGTARADAISSRPGYSDHQTGLACDLSSPTDPDTNLTQDFIDTEEGQWLYKHAHEYGFIMRYPVGKQDITGYAYEPWHYRYIGVEEATALYNTDPDLSFEEYYGVAGGDYEELG